MALEVSRFEVYLVNLDPKLGSLDERTGAEILDVLTEMFKA